MGMYKWIQIKTKSSRAATNMFLPATYASFCGFNLFSKLTEYGLGKEHAI